MIAQRPSGSAPVGRARAESLPFEDDSFDAAMAVLTAISRSADWRYFRAPRRAQVREVERPAPNRGAKT
jgi:hypothetical protein